MRLAPPRPSQPKSLRPRATLCQPRSRSRHRFKTLRISRRWSKHFVRERHRLQGPRRRRTTSDVGFSLADHPDGGAPTDAFYDFFFVFSRTAAHVARRRRAARGEWANRPPPVREASLNAMATSCRWHGPYRKGGFGPVWFWGQTGTSIWLRASIMDPLRKRGPPGTLDQRACTLCLRLKKYRSPCFERSQSFSKTHKPTAVRGPTTTVAGGGGGGGEGMLTGHLFHEHCRTHVTAEPRGPRRSIFQIRGKRSWKRPGAHRLSLENSASPSGGQGILEDQRGRLPRGTNGARSCRRTSLRNLFTRPPSCRRRHLATGIQRRPLQATDGGYG